MNIFKELNLCDIFHIDLVEKENEKGSAYNMAFIYVEKWYDNQSSLNFYEKVLDDDKQARVVYDDPWFWIVLKNFNPRPEVLTLMSVKNSITKLENRVENNETEISKMTDEAKKRITALDQYSELGSGFNIAMKDLEIRGAGDHLGGEQSGFINAKGFETYVQLDNARQDITAPILQSISSFTITGNDGDESTNININFNHLKLFI